MCIHSQFLILFVCFNKEGIADLICQVWEWSNCLVAQLFLSTYFVEPHNLFFKITLPIIKYRIKLIFQMILGKIIFFQVAQLYGLTLVFPFSLKKVRLCFGITSGQAIFRTCLPGTRLARFCSDQNGLETSGSGTMLSGTRTSAKWSLLMLSNKSQNDK